jgi:Dolichyl-phosphate-mannose-protein mannosyltransferase
VSVAAPSRPRPRLEPLPSPPRARRRLPTCALVVLGSAVLHTLLAWARPTPGYFPDEYIYAELGRSLSEGAGAVVRDAPAHFLPILHPLVTAPAWLLDSVGDGYRAAQAIQAVAMSLAAWAVYSLACRVHVGERLALVSAALTVLLPDVLYSAKIISEPVAFPLALAAVAAAVALFDRPTLVRQAGCLALVGLATLTRLQLAAIPLCYLLALLVVGLRQRCLRRFVREQWLAVGLLGAGVALAGALGLRGHFGYYPSFTYVLVDPGEAVRGFGANALVLAYAAGWVLVPAALLGLALALARPRSNAEAAFGALAGSLTLVLVLQAALYGDTEHVQQRYEIYALPLLLVAFASYARRGWPLRRAHALLVGCLAVAAAAYPLSGWAAADGAVHSYVLAALRRLEVIVGDVSLAALLVAVGVTVLGIGVAAAAAFRPARATSVAVGAVLAVFLATTAAAFDRDRAGKASIRAALLAPNPSWVDSHNLDDVPLLLSPRGTRNDAHSTLFWNRSVDRLLYLDGSELPDVFASARVGVDEAGRLSLPAGEPVLLDLYGTTLALHSYELLGTAPTKALVRPRGVPRLAFSMPGRYYDGRLASAGGIRIWPERPGGRLAGRLVLRVRVPGGERAQRVRLGGLAVRVLPGREEQLSVPVCAVGSWEAGFQTDALTVDRSRRVGPVASVPRFVRDPGAC